MVDPVNVNVKGEQMDEKKKVKDRKHGSGSKRGVKPKLRTERDRADKAIAALAEAKALVDEIRPIMARLDALEETMKGLITTTRAALQSFTADMEGIKTTIDALQSSSSARIEKLETDTSAMAESAKNIMEDLPKIAEGLKNMVGRIDVISEKVSKIDVPVETVPNGTAVPTS